MLFDVPYKLFRKVLPQVVYGGAIKKVFGRQKEFEHLDHFEFIYNHYCHKGLNFKDKTVLELGAGNQIYTALFFIHEGAKKVILVDPKIDFDQQARDKAIEDFMIFKKSSNNISDFLDKIEFHPGLESLPQEYISGIDLICSYTVLEHIKDLRSMFLMCKKLINQTGSIFHEVDLTDLIYHFFNRYKRLKSLWLKRMAFHLRYSNKMFSVLNDNKCYMNRKMLPDYLKIIEQAGLHVKELQKNPLTTMVRAHKDLKVNDNSKNAEDCKIGTFGILLAK